MTVGNKTGEMVAENAELPLPIPHSLAPAPYCLPSDSCRPSRYPRRKEICWLVARTKLAISGKREGVTRVAGPATLKAAITRPV